MILYNDGDSEELAYDEVKSLLLKPGRPPGTYRQVGKGPTKQGDSPPKSPTYMQGGGAGAKEGMYGGGMGRSAFYVDCFRTSMLTALRFQM